MKKENENKNHIKYTDEMAKQLFDAIGSKAATDAVSGLEKLAEANGTFEVCISTEDVDRHGEIVKQDGLDTANFMKNPVVLFGHNSWALPIGVCTEITQKDGKTIAKGVFASHTQAQGQRELYDMGLAATSIGFIVRDYDDESRTITKSELLEFSFVPIPANPNVHAIREAGLDVAELAMKGLLSVDMKTGDDVPVENSDEENDDDKDSDNAIIENDDETTDDDAPASDESADSESDDENSDEESDDETAEEKILSALGDIGKRLSALENSKDSGDTDVAGSESEEGVDDDSDDSDDDSDEPTTDETDDAVKFLRNRRKAQKAAKLINDVLADMAVDAKKHY